MICRRVIFILLGMVSVGASVSGQEERFREDSIPADAPSGRYMPPPSHAPGVYRLGIQARNTNTGVEIAAVSPGSVAQRSGLEVGDTVINVAGYQVGMVGGRLYDIGDELARRVQGDGRVELLVRNRRDGRLVNVPVQFLAAEVAAISGRLIAQGPVRYSPSATISIRLLDVTQPQWQGVVVHQMDLPNPGQLPRPYRLELPPLNPNHRYALDAYLEERGQILLQTPQAIPVAGNVQNASIDLVMTGRPNPGPGIPGGLQPRDQIQQWILGYLRRAPRPLEVEGWLADLQRGKSLTSVQAGILSSSELFERNRRSRDLYCADVYQLLYGQPPTLQQMNDLKLRYDRSLGVRLRFVEDLLKQPR
jgi:uncharacterized lipoprotein YbaY